VATGILRKGAMPRRLPTFQDSIPSGPIKIIVSLSIPDAIPWDKGGMLVFEESLKS